LASCVCVSPAALRAFTTLSAASSIAKSSASTHFTFGSSTRAKSRSTSRS
jgi:hypothetical protein